MTWQLALPILTNFGHGTVPGNRDCLQNQFICYGYTTKWFLVVQNERKLCQNIDIEGKNPDKPMLRLPRHEFSLRNIYVLLLPCTGQTEIYGEFGHSWLHSMGSFLSEHTENLGIFISWRG